MMGLRQSLWFHRPFYGSAVLENESLTWLFQKQKVSLFGMLSMYIWRFNQKLRFSNPSFATPLFLRIFNCLDSHDHIIQSEFLIGGPMKSVLRVVLVKKGISSSGLITILEWFYQIPNHSNPHSRFHYEFLMTHKL